MNISTSVFRVRYNILSAMIAVVGVLLALHSRETCAMDQPDLAADINARIQMAHNVLDNPALDKDLVQHVRACGTLASAEWSQQMLLLRQVAGVQAGVRLNAADIAGLAAGQPALKSELLLKSDALVASHSRRYSELFMLIEHSRWRDLARENKDLAVRWSLLQEQDADYAAYLSLRLFTGIDPEVRSAYYHHHCPSQE